MRKTISEIMRMDVAAKADSKEKLASSPGSTIKKPGADRVAIFRETAQGRANSSSIHTKHTPENRKGGTLNHHDSDLVEALKSVISEHEEVIAAYLYGSAAQGIMREDSDIDVGVLLADDAAPDYRYEVRMAGEIQSRCHLAREVDLRVLNRRPIRFLNQVLRYGKLVFVRDEKKRVEFETGVLKEYLDFKPFLREYDRERRRRLIYGD
ncbi:MAG TPA: nucleotidyltransferase domain-containing protein [Methanosarcinales archaeon]|nr:nucleotidyltransferase domain-containing protein [Methanosarcinales archaeon]